MKPLWIGLALLQLAARPLASESDETRDEQCNCSAETGIELLFGSQQDLLAKTPTGALAERAGQKKLQLELFVMSLCPYGMEAERILLPLVEQFAEWVELKIYFIADEVGKSPPKPSVARPATPGSRRSGCTAAASVAGTGPFRSLHGQQEIDEGRRQLIIQNDYPDRYWTYLLCRSRQGPQGEWARCAREVGLDSDTLQALALGPQGEALFRENIRRANELGIDLSPTLLIDGEEFTGKLETLALARRLCQHRGDDKRCQQVPVCGSDADCQAPPGQVALCENPDTPQARCQTYSPVPFTLTILKAAECRACTSTTFLRTTLELFPGAQVREISLKDPTGQALARRYGLEAFPAYIFSAEFARSPRFPRVVQMMRPVADAYLAHPRLISVTYWPQRPFLPGRLDLFVPLGAADLEEKFLRLWKGDPAQVGLHFLLGGIDPAAAPEELSRRACLAVEQPDRYLAYAAARVQARENWEEAARLAGIELTHLEDCVLSGQGQRYLAASQVLADSLALAPESPAALLENRLLVRRLRPTDLAALKPEGKEP